MRRGRAERPTSLRTSLVIALLLATLVPLVVAGTIGLGAQRATLTERVRDDLDQYADAQLARLELILGRGDALGQLVTSRTLLRELVREAALQPPGNLERIVRILDDARDASEGLTSIAVLTNDGARLAATSGPASPPLTPVVLERARDAALTGLPTSDLQPGSEETVWLRIAPMLLDGEVIGVAILELESAPLGELLASPTDGPGISPRIRTCLYIADAAGDPQVLQGGPSCPAQRRTSAAVLPAASAAIQGSTTQIDDIQDADGERLVAATRPLPDHGLGLVVSLSETQLLAPVTEASRLLGGLFLAVAAVALALAVLLARWLTRPILALQAATGRIAAGELRAEMPSSAPGELEDLRRSFVALTEAVGREQARQDDRYRDLEVLTHAMAHDLKGPLTVIRGMLELLSAGRVEDAAQAELLLERSLASAERMQRLIDDLLALIRAIGAPLRLEEVPLGEVVATTVEELDLGEVVTVEGLPVVVGERTLLEQIVLNLLGNAARYHDPAVPARIVVRTGQARDGLVPLVIDDAGVGIPADRREEMLETFVRGEKVDDRPGTGLGLPIAKRVAERHGGTLELADSPLGGTRVLVWLPLAGAGAATTAGVDAQPPLDAEV